MKNVSRINSNQQITKDKRMCYKCPRLPVWVRVWQEEQKLDDTHSVLDRTMLKTTQLISDVSSSDVNLESSHTNQLICVEEKVLQDVIDRCLRKNELL